MSDLEARIAEVLLGHAVMTAQHINTNHPVIQCKCGAEVTGGSEKWREHQAAMLAPLVREREAEAWGDGALAAYQSLVHGDTSTNPYKEQR